jgi:hypothetical protein
MLELPQEGSLTAHLKYEHGNAEIPLMRLSEIATSDANQIPTIVKTTFVELVGGQRTGQYVFTSQGGIAGDLIYFRQSDNREFVFYIDPAAATGKGCDWGPK